MGTPRWKEGFRGDGASSLGCSTSFLSRNVVGYVGGDRQGPRKLKHGELVSCFWQGGPPCLLRCLPQCIRRVVMTIYTSQDGCKPRRSRRRWEPPGPFFEDGFIRLPSPCGRSSPIV